MNFLFNLFRGIFCAPAYAKGAGLGMLVGAALVLLFFTRGCH